MRRLDGIYKREPKPAPHVCKPCELKHWNHCSRPHADTIVPFSPWTPAPLPIQPNWPYYQPGQILC